MSRWFPYEEVVEGKVPGINAIERTLRELQQAISGRTSNLLGDGKTKQQHLERTQSPNKCHGKPIKAIIYGSGAWHLAGYPSLTRRSDIDLYCDRSVKIESREKQKMEVERGVRINTNGESRYEEEGPTEHLRNLRDHIYKGREHEWLDQKLYDYPEDIDFRKKGMLYDYPDEPEEFQERFYHIGDLLDEFAGRTVFGLADLSDKGRDIIGRLENVPYHLIRELMIFLEKPTVPDRKETLLEEFFKNPNEFTEKLKEPIRTINGISEEYDHLIEKTEKARFRSREEYNRHIRRMAGAIYDAACDIYETVINEDQQEPHWSELIEIPA
ncbi:hypothetical protein CMI48_04505 [Candidatus Pacearchaeota archaeon]|nr:hypothetical protein [Candidatus Pacearchaeota archaeon]|tara:strand:+ start:786 stop:1766 length:981 start_codon:yes stop_codon:yes gene_type:complete